MSDLAVHASARRAARAHAPTLPVALTVALLAFAAPGCGGSGGGDDTPDVPAAELCRALAEAVCAAGTACCGSTLPSGGGGGDAGPVPFDCVGAQLDACRASLEPLARDPRTGYSPDRGGKLVARVQEASAACFSPPPRYADVVAIFEGTGEEGADCTPADTAASSLLTAALSCAGDTTCHLYLRSTGGLMGVCEAATEDCSHAFDCPPGEWCNLPAGWQPGVWGTCQPARTEGWGCAAALECASDYCHPDGECAPPPDGAFCAYAAYPTVVGADRPVAYWRLGDLTGGAALDASGHGHDGTHQGGPAPGAPGALAGDTDTALTLDGVDDAVLVAGASDLDTATAITLECWFKTSDATAGRRLLEYAPATGTAPGLRLAVGEAGDRIAVDLVDTTGASHELASAAASIAPAAWHHVAATYDGATARLYLDGAEAGNAAGAYFLATGGDLYLGGKPGAAGATFAGTLDECAVFDRALSPARVKAHADRGTLGPAATPSLIFGWLD